ncbi:MAG TPA: COX15/CtaA family protein [Vicinamibacterales bacterium]|nr:COX15/CtaA family protein [Vicinamibacterales bacterium]
MKLTSFQRLAVWTTATTYFLILVGGLVRASGAGLGCPDWPRCFGSWIPPASVADLPPQFDPALFNPTLMWTEYLNRVLGATVGLLILATAISAWRHHRHQPRILGSSIAAFLLVGYEGWLGGRVVAHELAPWIVTAHLIVAIVIVQLLLFATYEAFEIGAGGPQQVRADGDVAAARAAAALIALTLFLAGVGTQVRGSIDTAIDAGVAREAALATVGAMDIWHRNLALVVVIFSAVLTLWLASRRSPLLPWAIIVLVLAIAQVAIGLTMAYGALIPAAQVAHLTLASLLLGAQTLLWLKARR